MKDYHVILEGFNGFQKEETCQFVENVPSSKIIKREYEPLRTTYYAMPSGESIQCKDRTFIKKCSFYALGKNIVYYTEVA